MYVTTYYLSFSEGGLQGSLCCAVRYVAVATKTHFVQFGTCTLYFHLLSTVFPFVSFSYFVCPVYLVSIFQFVPVCLYSFQLSSLSISENFPANPVLLFGSRASLVTFLIF